MSQPTREADYIVSSSSVSFLEGIILTVIDASFSDNVQRKAVKDIVSQKIWQWAIDNPTQIRGKVGDVVYLKKGQKVPELIPE